MTTTTPHTAGSASHGYISDKDRYLARVKRIEGQTRGIHRMIDEDAYCIDILTQISAVNAGLESVALVLLDDHLKRCVAGAVKDSEESAAKLEEASAAIARLVRS
ncbi:metal-sensitive transcriptional regulator [Corynebacterium sp.]|uniref:metal-sensitive transcriptional regulator n=1 Tax=Corynebacterium sp. TaxID=1720 RepID=UPI0028A60BC7|nr:metal-sensitive transcriptional regulator [Corynebacterium sp.]